MECLPDRPPTDLPYDPVAAVAGLIALHKDAHFASLLINEDFAHGDPTAGQRLHDALNTMQSERAEHYLIPLQANPKTVGWVEAVEVIIDDHLHALTNRPRPAA